MASQSYMRLTLVALAPAGNPQESGALLELLKQRYGDALAARLPAGTNVRWHARTSADVIDFAAFQLDNGGYAAGDPAAAATWVVTCCRAWLGVLRADPISREELNSTVGHTPNTMEKSGDLRAMTDWIFQATPKRYDVHAAVAESRQDWWNTPRYRDQIAINDRVWLQIAGPDAPGIYYLATIMSLPYEAEAKEGEAPTFGRWRTDIRFDYSIEPPLLSLPFNLGWSSILT